VAIEVVVAAVALAVPLIKHLILTKTLSNQYQVRFLFMAVF